MTTIWSDKPDIVASSYITLCTAVLDITKSIHDPELPLMNVLHARGPGYIPLRRCHPYNSHNSMSHGALVFVSLSTLFLGIFTLSISGESSPTRVFQSPHITYVAWCGIHPNMSSTWLLAICSSIPRFYKLGAGGRYTFPIQIFSPPYPWIHRLYVYSFPKYRSTLIPFFTSTAIPPLLPFSRRYSKAWYPGIFSFIVDVVSHVS